MANVSFVGRLGKDAEFKSGKGTDYLTFSVAEDVGFGDNKKTQWINCVVFGKSAQGLSKLLVKGQEVYVTGSLELEEYTNKNGETKQNLKVVASNTKLIGEWKSKENAPSEAPKINQKVLDAPYPTLDEDDIPF
jgi:single-strand DNA-binding protein